MRRQINGAGDNKLMYKLVAVNSQAVESVENLKRLGIDVFEIKGSGITDDSTTLHADMLVNLIADDILLIDESQLEIADFASKYTESRVLKQDELVKYLTSESGEGSFQNFRGLNIVPVKEKITSPYPNDVPLNVRVVGKSIICNKKYVADEIKLFAKYRDFNLIQTNQGYAGCSCVKLNNSVLTDDRSIYNSLNDRAIDCTIISKGSIKLNGMNYGFIGGCCGYLDKNVIGFNGEIKSHTDGDLIIKTLDDNKINYIELASGILTDIGGIVPIIK